MQKLIKHALTVVVAAAAVQSASAQFYFGGNLGYGVGASGDSYGTDDTYNSSGDLTSSKQIHGTYGAGLNIQLNGGYKLSENFAFDLGVNYLMGSKKLADRTTTSAGEYTKYVQTSQVRLTPTLIVSAGGEGKLTPYTRFGLVIPVAGKTVSTEVDKTNSSMSSEMVRESKGKPTIGFEGGVGVRYKLSENLALSAELVYTALRIRTKSAEITKYNMTMGGTTTDVLATMKTGQKEYNFVEELTSSSNNSSTNSNYDVNKATDLLSTSSNFNNFGIRVGVVYTLGAAE